MAERCDAIVIGSGAGGGALAHTLAPTGKRILLLERGDFLPRELANWDVEEVFEENRYISEDTWFDADGRDTSFFPSIGAVNPALTAIANAIRVGERLAERLA